MHQLRHIGLRKKTRVQFFVNDDARIVAQFPGDLAVADIDRVNFGRTALQQTIREPAGRSADVDCSLAANIETEMIERAGQF